MCRLRVCTMRGAAREYFAYDRANNGSNTVHWDSSGSLGFLKIWQGGF